MTSVSSQERSACFDKLVSLLSEVSPSKFRRFNVHRAVYKETAGCSIAAEILVPRSGKLSKRWPVLVRIHGGFLITGSSLYPAWFSNWILDYATTHGALIVSPNYRLLPEVSGSSIIEDIEDFWQWLDAGGVQRQLASRGQSDFKLDLEKVLVVGESAGGYLAIQCAFSHPTRIRAVITANPMLDLRSHFYTQPFAKTIVGVPNYPPQIVDEFLLSVGGPVTEADPPVRLDLAMAIVQNGRLLEFLGTQPDLFPLEKLVAVSRPKDRILPPLFIFHGEDDTAVPVEGTRAFVRELRRADPDAKVHVAIRPGDHGFDADADLADPWLMEGLRFISETWIGS